ncbi:MAG: hypothetical protein ABIL70_00410 [candidate division WOR-3 bacterium]
MRWFFFILLTTTISCHQRDIWSKIREGNYEIIRKGSYRGKLKYLAQPGEHEATILRFRADIEKNIALFPEITKKFFVITDELKYQYKFTWLDEEKNYLILRYFARIYNHPVYAGYQIQFVIDKKEKQIIQIFITEVPLE